MKKSRFNYRDYYKETFPEGSQGSSGLSQQLTQPLPFSSSQPTSSYQYSQGSGDASRRRNIIPESRDNIPEHLWHIINEFKEMQATMYDHDQQRKNNNEEFQSQIKLNFNELEQKINTTLDVLVQADKNQLKLTQLLEEKEQKIIALEKDAHKFQKKVTKFCLPTDVMEKFKELHDELTTVIKTGLYHCHTAMNQLAQSEQARNEIMIEGFAEFKQLNDNNEPLTIIKELCKDVVAEHKSVLSKINNSQFDSHCTIKDTMNAEIEKIHHLLNNHYILFEKLLKYQAGKIKPPKKGKHLKPLQSPISHAFKNVKKKSSPLKTRSKTRAEHCSPNLSCLTSPSSGSVMTTGTMSPSVLRSPSVCFTVGNLKSKIVKNIETSKSRDNEAVDDIMRIFETNPLCKQTKVTQTKPSRETTRQAEMKYELPRVVHVRYKEITPNFLFNDTSTDEE